MAHIHNCHIGLGHWLTIIMGSRSQLVTITITIIHKAWVTGSQSLGHSSPQVIHNNWAWVIQYTVWVSPASQSLPTTNNQSVSHWVNTGHTIGLHNCPQGLAHTINTGLAHTQSLGWLASLPGSQYTQLAQQSFIPHNNSQLAFTGPSVTHTIIFTIGLGLGLQYSHNNIRHTVCTITGSGPQGLLHRLQGQGLAAGCHGYYSQ